MKYAESPYYGDYYFFVTDTLGNYYFNKTAEEHQAQVDKQKAEGTMPGWNKSGALKRRFYVEGLRVLNKPELLSPAGDLERLRFAVRYGADAVVHRCDGIWNA